MNFNLKQLEVFAAVVECGSFTAAARKLYLAQSTVSGHMASLEKEIGFALIDRNGKREITLTEEGRKVYLHARSILQDCSDLSRELEEHTSVELSIGASTIPMQYVLPGLISDFSRLIPGCKYVLKDGDSTDVHQMVLDGHVQIGFVGATLNREKLVYEQLTEDKLVLAAPKNERFEVLLKEKVPGNLLLTEPLIFREAGSGTQQAADRFLCDNNVNTEGIHVVAKIGSNEAILRAVAGGLGLSIVSELAAESLAEQGKILVFSLEGKSTTRSLYMIHAKDRRLTKAAKAFWDYTAKNGH
ncbi:MAG: selenium metabolism-associated LysR family transcriptional regulator [Candidatus Metalachnospira sp.]|nr:selenium metabolism-associated LysR family transcriptional regulator [Candidatus Metalachnospira sp.]